MFAQRVTARFRRHNPEGRTFRLKIHSRRWFKNQNAKRYIFSARDLARTVDHRDMAFMHTIEIAQSDCCALCLFRYISEI